MFPAPPPADTPDGESQDDDLSTDGSSVGGSYSHSKRRAKQSDDVKRSREKKKARLKERRLDRNIQAFPPSIVELSNQFDATNARASASGWMGKRLSKMDSSSIKRAWIDGTIYDLVSGFRLIHFRDSL